MRHMIVRPVLGILLLTSLGVARPVQAYNILDYFAITLPGVCTSRVDTGNPYLTGRIYQGSPNQCTGLTVYHRVNGTTGQGVVAPGGSESYYVQNGWLWLMKEIFYQPTTGTIEQYRAFRNQTSYWKGIRWLPVSFPTYGTGWNPQPYTEEFWTNSQGTPVCFNTTQTSITGGVYASTVHWGGYLVGHLQDRRAASANPNVWHDVETIRRADYYEASSVRHRETYWYGRWQNPATGAREPLGLVRWEHAVLQSTWVTIGTEEYRYLVDCTYSLPCTTCPP